MNKLTLYVEKKKGFDVQAKGLWADFKINLGLDSIKDVRIINRYCILGISEEVYEMAKKTIFAELPVDNMWENNIQFEADEKVFAVEYLPGQYDQTADSAEQCIKILTQSEGCKVKTAKIIVVKGDLSNDEFEKIKNYYINPVDSREASIDYINYDEEVKIPTEVDTLDGFIDLSDDQLRNFAKDNGLAMAFEDIKMCQEYFKNSEHRNPTITEIKVIDTYWSDHCRHTTFLTKINNVEFEDGKYKSLFEEAYKEYNNARASVYAGKVKDVCLMDLAVIGMKELRKLGLLEDLEESDEINACSIIVNVDVNGKDEEWLVMFKNETHNHPTEIEPFGGAATCLGGAIRDPLSGRAYVYQAMRVTGSGDPRTKVADTMKGKLPQRKITKGAAHGYSSYGNQIGLATGQVTEIYDEGYVAKRMEIGAVIAATPRKNVIRDKSETGDIIILLGGRTGRDGCGGATGSSKEHTKESIETCGAEVQKGNPPTERKIQRLFRNEEVATMIKKCNDFGAGGVSVAIGELADGLLIDLNLVPKKYEGLDGTELSISESQERMAVVIDRKNEKRFIQLAGDENLEAVKVADVTDNRRLKMKWNEKNIVDISRDFLDTNGATQITDVYVSAPNDKNDFVENYSCSDLKELWINKLQDLNTCSQKGLSEMFDSTIGAGTVLMPFGGKYQNTPNEAMVAKIPLEKGETKTGTAMSFGFDPRISKWSPFHGGIYAIVEALSKIVAIGGNHRNVRLSCQEYFERLGNDKVKWGKPFSALLGAYYAQKKLEVPSIGGKDSMSGTFEDLTVPPTLVAFAVDIVNTENVISSEFKQIGSNVILIETPVDELGMPDFEVIHKNFDKIYQLISNKKVLSASALKKSGLAESISKMCFGNKFGFKFNNEVDINTLFKPDYGSITLEISKDENLGALLGDTEYSLIGQTIDEGNILVNGQTISLDEIIRAWESPLEPIFPTQAKAIYSEMDDVSKYSHSCKSVYSGIKIARPKVFIPVFPGTNCEYDTKAAFEKAGADVDIFVVKNLKPSDIEETVEAIAKKVKESQIVMLPGGFSAGDEPDGSGKFIATMFRNPYIKDAVMDMLKNRDGLILGICNGFQALIKLGLLPYGEITEIAEESPTLTFNTIGRHVSTMVNTKIVSKISPWLNNVKLGDTYTIPVSHGEGRFAGKKEVIEELIKNGQVATQYVDLNGNPTYEIQYNPNGSYYAIEGITSPDGRILGKMGHSERIGNNLYKNIIGEKDQKLFKSGVEYFK